MTLIFIFKQCLGFLVLIRSSIILCTLILVGLTASQESYALCQEKAKSDLAAVREIMDTRSVAALADWEEVKSSADYIQYKGRLNFALAQYDIQQKVEFLYYKSSVTVETGEPAPLIFIMSSIAGTTQAEKHIARYLAKQGISTVVSFFREHEGEDEGPDIANTWIDIAVSMTAQMSLIDFFETLPEVRADAMGMIGISLGGIRGTFVMGVEPRLKAATLVVSGGDFYDIMATSQNPAVKKIRLQQMESLGLSSVEAYRDVLQGYQQYNALDLICERDSEEVQLFVDRRDKTVPYPTQQQLQQALGASSVYESNLGHLGGVLWYLARHVQTSVDFFTERWGISEGNR